MPLSKECYGTEGKCSLFVLPKHAREKEENILFSRDKELEPAKDTLSVRWISEVGLL